MESRSSTILCWLKLTEALSPQLRDTRDDRGQAGPVSHVTIHHTTLHHHIKLYTPELAWPSHSHKTFSSVKSFTADCILQSLTVVLMSSLQSAVPHKSAWCNWLSSSPRHDFLSPVAGPVVWTVESIITFVYLRWCCCYVGTGTAWWLVVKLCWHSTQYTVPVCLTNKV